MEAKKNNRGVNGIYITLQTEILDLIKVHAGKEHLHNNFWVAKMILSIPEVRDELVLEYGQEAYNGGVTNWSRKNVEITEMNRIESDARAARKKLREETEQKLHEAYIKNAETGHAKVEIREEALTQSENSKFEECEKRYLALKEKPDASEYNVKKLLGLGYTLDQLKALEEKRLTTQNAVA